MMTWRAHSSERMDRLSPAKRAKDYIVDGVKCEVYIASILRLLT